jgi:hypothetical protein
MWSRFSGSGLGTNIKAAVIGWVVAMAGSLLLGALLFALGPFTSWSGRVVSVWIFAAFAASLAILFLAGFVCSRFAAGRAAVWILIVLLLLPRVLRNEWGNPWIHFQGGAQQASGLRVVTGITVGAIVTWLVAILPVVAGAGFGERRRRASR